MARRVLFITRFNPWPAHGGARIHNFNILQALSKCFEIDLLTVGPPEPAVEALCRRVFLASPYYGDETLALSARRWSSGSLTSALTGQPLWLSSKTPPAMRREARRLATLPEYSAIHASELSSAVDLIDLDHPPLLYDAHNCEWRLLAKRATAEPAPLKYFVSWEAKSLRRIEARVLSAVDAVLAVSDGDRKNLQTLAGAEKPIYVLPNLVDVDHYSKPRECAPEAGVILVPGKWDWRPNAIGLNWFCDRVLPVLHRSDTASALRIVVAGQMTQAMAARLDKLEGVVAVRNPPDMTPYFAAATVIAAPVLVSSGTRLRMIEAMASQRPIVTTGPGAAGLEGGADDAWLQTDDATAFARHLLAVVNDPDLWRRLVGAGWRYVQAYDWRASVDPLQTIYNKLGHDCAKAEMVRSR